MPSARNSAELRKMLEQAAQKAMRVVQKKVEADMYEETGDFYTGGEPKMYQRTGALGDTQRTTAIGKTGDGFEFKAYLDQSHQYTTGDDPSMAQVLDLANYGIPWTTKGGRPAKATVGKKGFWERAEERMEKTLNDTMGQVFN